MYGVILAGGSGTRFWPRSREKNPKQLLQIIGPGTMIQNTVERLLPLIPIQKMYVVTNEGHAFETCSQLSKYGFCPSHLFAEPVGRNTAAAIGFAARVLKDQGDDEVMGVFPADHAVKDPEHFRQVLKKAETVAAAGSLVALGIEPTRPETGYGYIRKGNPLAGLNGAFRTDRFVEKPDAATAEEFLKQGGYLWNCGVFLWKISSILEEIQTHLPDLYQHLDTLVSQIQERKGKYLYRVLSDEGRKIFASLPSISIDYGIMEKSDRGALVPAEIQWSDLGAWNALEEVAEKDTRGNILSANVVPLDCTGSIIQGQDRLIATVGLKDLIVIDSPDALLVCDKKRAQDVRRLVDKIKDEKRPEAEIPTTVKKPWGSYTVLEKQEGYLVKRLVVFPGEKLSLQSHAHRRELWNVVSGQAEVQREKETFILKKGESTMIPENVRHRLSNPGETPLTIIEVQLGKRLEEDDILRYDDLYGRS